MPRPQRSRLICREPYVRQFSPTDRLPNGSVDLTLDELEVLRLIDREGRTHEQCAAHMGVSRTTVTEICERARRKLMEALLDGRMLNIGGGNYHVCSEENRRLCGVCNCDKPAAGGEDGQI